MYPDEQQLLKSKSQFYLQEDKPGKMLANCLRGSRGKKLIIQIQTADGNITSNLIETNDTFRDYSSNLYASELQNYNMQMHTLFDYLNIPGLSPDDRDLTDK